MKENVDPKFSERIARWLQSPHRSADQVKAGAELLLSVNRDRQMYQRILHNPRHELAFLEYKLKKILKMRRDGMTVRDVVAMDREVTPQIKEAIAAEEKAQAADSTSASAETSVRKGIRPDHERLPKNIQALWMKNAERWKKIKQTFESLKQLSAPCDRYELLKTLKKAWYDYKNDMARYDDYVLKA